MTNQYTIQVIVIDKVSHYHVVNTSTMKAHSVWRTYNDAQTAVRDLHNMIRRMGA